MAKNLPAMWETWVQSLDWEDPLEKGMAILLSILAWRTPWTEEPGGEWSMGSQRVHLYFPYIYIRITESLCCTHETNTTL